MKDKRELHLVIIWSNASIYIEEIMKKINERFEIKDVYKVSWTKKDFVKNLIIFYSHSQYHLNFFKMKKMMEGKAKHCGREKFDLIIFEDLYPNYKKRKTSSGTRLVNVNIFDLKQQLRKMMGGGHKIHSTDSVEETNKDLTLLLGLNITDYLKKNDAAWNGRFKLVKRNVTGLNGYKTLENFFYVLNSSTKYLVLRNFEGFPENYISSKHGDIDILVENLKFMVYLTSAKKVFRGKNRVHYRIDINGQKILFDFRYIGDNYYDIKWEKELLENRIFEKKFFKPDHQNYFYSLLYHSLVHKPEYSLDYIEKLIGIGRNINIKFEEKIKKVDSALGVLNDYLKKNKYQYVEPLDPSVFFNNSYQLKKIGLIRKINQFNYQLRAKASILKRKIKNH